MRTNGLDAYIKFRCDLFGSVFESQHMKHFAFTRTNLIVRVRIISVHFISIFDTTISDQMGEFDSGCECLLF